LDINGAKVLKKRLGPNGRFEPQPAGGDVEASEDAPPVFHWFGISRPASSEQSDDDEAATAVSMLQRLGLNFR
jgi:hypothetical protein